MDDTEAWKHLARRVLRAGRLAVLAFLVLMAIGFLFGALPQYLPKPAPLPRGYDPSAYCYGDNAQPAVIVCG